MENFVEVIRRDCGVYWIDARVHIWIALFIEIGFAVVCENTHFGCHDFDDRFPSSFIEFVGGYESMTAAAGGFNHGFVLQGDFLRFWVYPIVRLFVSATAGKELGK